MPTLVNNLRAIRGPVTAVPVTPGSGIEIAADTENNQIVISTNLEAGSGIDLQESNGKVTIINSDNAQALPIVAGAGVKLSVVNNQVVVSADETVLADNIANDATSFTLSEKPSNFERLRMISTKGLICEISSSDSYLSWGYFWVDQSNGVGMQRIYTATSSNGTSWSGGKVYGYNMNNNATVAGQYGASGWHMETKKIVGINRIANN